jgi:hypothetical protein
MVTKSMLKILKVMLTYIWLKIYLSAEVCKSNIIRKRLFLIRIFCKKNKKKRKKQGIYFLKIIKKT